MTKLTQKQISEIKAKVIDAAKKSSSVVDGWCKATSLGGVIKNEAKIDYKSSGYENLRSFIQDILGVDFEQRGTPPQHEYKIIKNTETTESNSFSEIKNVQTETLEDKTIPTNTICANLYDLGFVHQESWEKLSQLSGVPDISIKSINNYLIEEPKYLNKAGYPNFPDGTPVSVETGKFILLRTSLKQNDGSQIIGWFNRDTRDKQKPTYRGIVWGTDEEFENSKVLSRNCQIGRMIFHDWEGCKDFFESLNKKIIPEPWAYKNKLEGDFKYPILKSYLQFELDRLFYEDEVLNQRGKVLYSPDKSMILFNTNLINKYGDDLFIVGKRVLLNGKICISDLEVAPSKSRLSKCGFSTISTPNPPQFFKDINEIVFHCSWEIDDDMEKREHIIEERIARFPERYRDLRPDDLGQKLNNAINFATKIAQRNYKFIVPMYYPTKQRIQLLMPIYLDTTYSDHPDFALVLTPCEDAKLYVPETILGLDEVYQDARLIAKPEESWLNPNMIK